MAPWIVAGDSGLASYKSALHLAGLLGCLLYVIGWLPGLVTNQSSICIYIACPLSICIFGLPGGRVAMKKRGT